ncbi:Translation initiation factor IF-1 [Candidatus Hodgkinia cicadicola]|nr:Translation initiation factor IF-1 [Candidatus Hodgkinia cicadicola]
MCSLSNSVFRVRLRQWQEIVVCIVLVESGWRHGCSARVFCLVLF